MKVWTPVRISRAIEVLRQTPKDRLSEALATLSQEFGFNVTDDALRFGVYRYGHTTVPRELGLDVEAERAIAPVDARDTERMPTAPAVDLPDDAWTTPPVPPPSRPAKTPEEKTADELRILRLERQNEELDEARKRLLRDIADKQEQIEILKELRAAKPLGPIVAPKKVGGMQRNGVPVMLCSDWHVEEEVDPRTINGLNKYDLDIADACITRMAEAYEWFLRDSRFDCRAGVVWLGGDLISGYIHEELVEGNLLSPVEGVLWLQERIERMLRTIAATCPDLERIIVPCNDGNHGRLTNKIRVSTRTANSIEWLMYKSLAAKMADDPRFEFDVADGEWTFVEVFGKTLGFTHGDSFAYGGGVGGISIPIRRGIDRQFQHRTVDYFNLGHFHQRNDFGAITVNGSMIGFNAYAQRLHAKPEPRQQTWFLIDSEHGKSFTAPVWLPQYDRSAA
jgi:hypothetical protein